MSKRNQFCAKNKLILTFAREEESQWSYVVKECEGERVTRAAIIKLVRVWDIIGWLVALRKAIKGTECGPSNNELVSRGAEIVANSSTAVARSLFVRSLSRLGA